jgi:hypothetical protein
MDPMGQFQQMPMAQGQHMMHGGPKPDPNLYGLQGGYPENAYQTLPYDTTQGQHDLHYTTVSPQASMLDQHQSGSQNVFSTPPMQQQQQVARVEESSPEAYSPEAYQQQDLADLLGTLKVDEVGTGTWRRFRLDFVMTMEPRTDD